MTRKHNTDKNGGQWSEQTKKTIWQNSREIPNFPTDLWRHDRCGLVMKWSEYGNRQSKYGWEIDHINPVSNNGDDNIRNLQALNWKNNADKSDKLNWTCPSK